jgi:putative transposase
VRIFEFIAAKKAEHTIGLMCRVLGVSRSGYHAWVTRPPSARALEDARLTERISELFALRRKVYGSPRIWADLVLDDGERIGRKRVERLMRQAGLSALMEKKWRRTTIRVPGVRVAEDLLDRDFAAGAPNRCWVADITYLRTWEGWLYLVAVQDLYSRRIVGWAMADHMRAEFVVDALQMALARRRPDPGLIWHSDQGIQFVSLAFGQKARAAGSHSRWATRETASITPSPRASSRRSRKNSYTAAHGRPRTSSAAKSSTTSRSSTTASAATAPSGNAPPPSTRRSNSIS